MQFLAVIPARYASSRFPGKPLAVLGGKPVIARVVENVRKALPDAGQVVVATDTRAIADAAHAAGAEAVLTDPQLPSGTDRIRQGVDRLASAPDVVINIQGDEPFVVPEQVRALMDCFIDETVQIATLVRRFDPDARPDELFNPNTPKVVLAENGDALWFSRSVIPYVRGYEPNEWLKHADFYAHVGMYAYRLDVLHHITELPQSSAEKAESLEQLRWLQNGYRIRTAVTTHRTIGIDTPEDLAAAERFLSASECKK